MKLEINGKIICYETSGDPANAPLILIMGIAGQLVHWLEGFIDALVDKGFYVIRFDNRDVGLSSYYDDLPTPEIGEFLSKLQRGEPQTPPYTLNDMGDDLADLMEGLGISKAHIAGTSLGGQIAQCFALNQPDRLLSLTLMMTSSSDPGLPEPSPEVMGFFFGPKPKNLEEAKARHLKQYQIYNPHDFDLDAAAKMHELAYARAYHPAGLTRHLLAAMSARPRGEQLKALNLKTLVIHGDSDPICSVEHGEQLASCLNAQITVFEKMGHGLPTRVHEPIADAMSKMI